MVRKEEKGRIWVCSFEYEAPKYVWPGESPQRADGVSPCFLWKLLWDTFLSTFSVASCPRGHHRPGQSWDAGLLWIGCWASPSSQLTFLTLLGRMSYFALVCSINEMGRARMVGEFKAFHELFWKLLFLVQQELPSLWRCSLRVLVEKIGSVDLNPCSVTC